jgi:endoglucanase
MNVFRIPFKWERLQPTIGQDFAASYAGSLDAVVSYATGKGIWVLLDVHK